MSGKTFIPESGLSTDTNMHASSNVPPKRTAPGITPPAVLKEADKVASEFQKLGSKIEGDHPIGRYHSFFYDMLTWKHPRASGLILAGLLGTLIFSQTIYLPRFIFRILWITLAATTSMEVAGQFVFRSEEGLVAKFAPKRYLTLERKQVDPIFDELFSLANFFLSEAQRLLFVKNVKHTAVAFALSFVAYNLIKFLPLSALIGLGIIVAFTAPPIYLRHKQVIDEQWAHAQQVSSQQYQQVKGTAAHQAGAAVEHAKSAAIGLGNKVGVDMNRYLSGPGPVMNKEVQDELAKQEVQPSTKAKNDVKDAAEQSSEQGHKMTTEATEAVSAFTAKVPGEAKPVGQGGETKSPPVEEHVKDSKTHDEVVKPAEDVVNKESIPITN